MARSKEILDGFETLEAELQSLREKYLAATASLRDRLCGTWRQKNLRTSFRIYGENDAYRIEIRHANDINGHVKRSAYELLEDAEGNLYVKDLEWAVGYDPEKDSLLVERYGAFERKISKNEDEK